MEAITHRLLATASTRRPTIWMSCGSWCVTPSSCISPNSNHPDSAYFNGNWLLRAAGARLVIYGLDAIEATYPATRMDAAGEPLDASKHTYTITFPAGKLPPSTRSGRSRCYSHTSRPRTTR
jgi:hypothetical protein